VHHDSGDDRQGCNNGEGIPEYRCYPKFGRIEDEVIQRHKEDEERRSKWNALI
jgi:hypothetical protein